MFDSLLRSLALRNIRKQDGNFVVSFALPSKRIDVIPPVHGCCMLLKTNWLTCKGHFAVCFKPISFMTWDELTYPFTSSILKARLCFKHRINFQKAVINW